jgi:TetR/AcrR family transcriptional repressor of nem operon
MLQVISSTNEMADKGKIHSSLCNINLPTDRFVMLVLTLVLVKCLPLPDNWQIRGLDMTKKQALLKAAEDKVRSGGYSNFSFRELAKEVGIKSASVHYHFPTKADLGAALARQYTDNFMDLLGDPVEIHKADKSPIQVYTTQFRRALLEDKKMCLCGLLGAETDCLPEKVQQETKRFFRLNLQWLQVAHKLNSPIDVEQKAASTLSLLEGAMMVSKALGDNRFFEQATNSLK